MEFISAQTIAETVPEESYTNCVLVTPDQVDGMHLQNNCVLKGENKEFNHLKPYSGRLSSNGRPVHVCVNCGSSSRYNDSGGSGRHQHKVHGKRSFKCPVPTSDRQMKRSRRKRKRRRHMKYHYSCDISQQHTENHSLEEVAEIAVEPLAEDSHQSIDDQAGDHIVKSYEDEDVHTSYPSTSCTTYDSTPLRMRLEGLYKFRAEIDSDIQALQRCVNMLDSDDSTDASDDLSEAPRDIPDEPEKAEAGLHESVCQTALSENSKKHVDGDSPQKPSEIWPLSQRHVEKIAGSIGGKPSLRSEHGDKATCLRVSTGAKYSPNPIEVHTVDAQSVDSWLRKVEPQTPSGIPGMISINSEPSPSMSTPKTPMSFAQTTPYNPDAVYYASDGEASFVLNQHPFTCPESEESPEFTDFIFELSNKLVTAYLTISSSAFERTSQSIDGNLPRGRKTEVSTHSFNPATSSQQPPHVQLWHKGEALVSIEDYLPHESDNISNFSSCSGGYKENNRTDATTIVATVGTARQTPVKRKRHGSDDEDAEDQKRRRPRRVIGDGSVQVEAKLLACPYTKFDPLRYSHHNVDEKNYRGCSSCYIRDIPRLKQHLHRIHRRPELHCPVCFVSFTCRVALDAHIVERTCAQVECPFGEKMTPDQYIAVKQRKMACKRSDAWFSIFKILFPEETLPLSPYVESAHVFTVNDFTVFFDRDAQNVLSQEINRQMFGDGEVTFDQQQFRDRVWQESVVVLIQHLETREQQGLFIEQS